MLPIPEGWALVYESKREDEACLAGERVKRRSYGFWSQTIFGAMSDCWQSSKQILKYFYLATRCEAQRFKYSLIFFILLTNREGSENMHAHMPHTLHHIIHTHATLTYTHYIQYNMHTTHNVTHTTHTIHHIQNTHMNTPPYTQNTNTTPT